MVTLSTHDNAKLLEQLRSGFKRKINWNKYQPKVSTKRQNQYLDFLIDPSFQGVKRPFVLSFENEDDGKVSRRCYLPKVEIKDYMLRLMEKSLLISQWTVILEHVIFKKLKQIKEIIIQLVVCHTITILKSIMRWYQ